MCTGTCTLRLLLCWETDYFLFIFPPPPPPVLHLSTYLLIVVDAYIGVRYKHRVQQDMQSRLDKVKHILTNLACTVQ